MSRAEGSQRRVRLSVVVGTALSLLFPGGRAAAQDNSEDRAAAQVLYDEGRKLTANGKYAEACPKFEESQKLDPGFGTAFYLADCWQHVGRTASSWALYLDVAAQTKAAGQLDRSTLAKARADALEAKLSRMSITVANPSAGIHVERDGVSVGKALWGTAVPVDPGEHKVRATAPGRKPWEATVVVAPDGASESVAIPALEEAPVETPNGPIPPAGATGPGGADRGAEEGRTLAHTGQLGAFLRADGAGIGFVRDDGAGHLIGPSPAVGVSYGAASFLEVSAAAILGDNKGFEPQGTALLLEGALKPRVTIAVPVLFVEGARAGLRGSVGIEWDPSRNVGAFLDLGAAYFFSMPAGYDKLVPVPSVGVSARL